MQETWSPTRRLCHKHGRSSTITCRPNTISCKNDIASLFFEKCLWTKIVLVIFWVLCTSCNVRVICSSRFDILMCWCLQTISSTSYKSMWERLCSYNKAKRGDFCNHTHFCISFACACAINSIYLRASLGILTIYPLQVPAKQTAGLALQALYQRCGPPKAWCSGTALLCYVVLIVSYLCHH